MRSRRYVQVDHTIVFTMYIILYNDYHCHMFMSCSLQDEFGVGESNDIFE